MGLADLSTTLLVLPVVPQIVQTASFSGEVGSSSGTVKLAITYLYTHTYTHSLTQYPQTYLNMPAKEIMHPEEVSAQCIAETGPEHSSWDVQGQPIYGADSGSRLSGGRRKDSAPSTTLPHTALPSGLEKEME